MCLQANRLRYALYRTAEQLSGEMPMSDATRAILERNREMPEYQAALKVLRDHLRECVECIGYKRMRDDHL